MYKAKTNILTSLIIDNFRVFGKETQFDFAPITILTGTNSSGKSSLTKAIMLLARSYQISGLRKLNFLESDLKIGGFKSAKNNQSSSEIISFALMLEPSNLEIKLYFNEQNLGAFQIYENGVLFLADLLDRNSDCKVSPYFNLPETILNKEKFRSLLVSKSENEFNHIFERMIERFRSHRFSPFAQEFSGLDVFSETFSGWTQGISCIGETPDLEVGPESKFPNKYLFDIMPEIVIEFGLEGLETNDFINSSELDKIKLGNEWPFSANILIFFSQFVLIPSVRAKQEFLITAANSPLLFKQMQNLHNNKDLTAWTNVQLEKWLVKEFKMMDFPDYDGLGGPLFQIIAIEDLGYQMQLYIDGKWTNLGSVGYGISQLLPVVLSVILNESPKTYIIEEPESNLHPALQSKLADFFASSLELGDPITNKRLENELARSGQLKYLHYLERPDNRFIVETHSEYLIRKLQYLTARDESNMSPNDVAIYYFYNPKDIPVGEPQVYKINISENGSLSKNFGQGFLDETSNLSLLLYQTLANKN